MHSPKKGNFDLYFQESFHFLHFCIAFRKFPPLFFAISSLQSSCFRNFVQNWKIFCFPNKLWSDRVVIAFISICKICFIWFKSSHTPSCKSSTNNAKNVNRRKPIVLNQKYRNNFKRLTFSMHFKVSTHVPMYMNFSIFNPMYHQNLGFLSTIYLTL